MSTFADRIHRCFQFVAAIVCLLAFAACEDDPVPPPQPVEIGVVSGDGQYTRKGTQLEDAVVVQVVLEDGAPAAGVRVSFQVTQGGGTLSRTGADTGADGRTSVRWTMGPDTGENQIRISVADNTDLSTIATATASEYYCPEEDPAFSQKFTSSHNLMMLTNKSSHTEGTAGLVRYTINSTVPATFTGQSFENYPEGVIQHAIRDLVFATNGDLFISWNYNANEVVKVTPVTGTVTHFATLESSFGSEIALTPNGVLIGCDERGPFYVTCRDSIYRFEGAIYSGDQLSRDATNNDALACDPTTGDVYFIYKADRDLIRVSFDGTTSGTPAKVADLTLDESDGARGMVVDGTDGSLYILVESTNTKSIVRVTSGGVLSTLYNFFDRGAGTAAGVQSDLAIDRDLRYLYTLDTQNNVFLLYGLVQNQLVTIGSDGNPDSASNSSVGEPVGLDVVP